LLSAPNTIDMSDISDQFVYDLPVRMRRLRNRPRVRKMLQETHLRTEQLIAPLFVKEGIPAPEPVDSMPGVFRLSIPDLIQECRRLLDLGIQAIALFPCNPPEIKDPFGSGALDPTGLASRAIMAIKEEVPEMTVIADIALDPYTSHGHDGVLNADKTDVDNDATLNVLTQMARILAESGADWVAPSDMMDGRVGAIRDVLDDAGYANVSIMAYSAKFNSAYYGPFRDAVGSQSSAGKTYLDKGTYQLNPANPREAIRDALMDEEEGADILMVKPAGAYLDIISNLRQSTELPVAAYQVSGEYAQIHAAAEKGWLDLKRTRDESLLAIRRAGADLILTYFAGEIAAELAK
jgi:porphobilinogen synthase